MFTAAISYWTVHAANETGCLQYVVLLFKSDMYEVKTPIHCFSNYQLFTVYFLFFTNRTRRPHPFFIHSLYFTDKHFCIRNNLQQQQGSSENSDFVKVQWPKSTCDIKFWCIITDAPWHWSVWHFTVVSLQCQCTRGEGSRLFFDFFCSFVCTRRQGFRQMHDIIALCQDSLHTTDGTRQFSQPEENIWNRFWWTAGMF